MNDCFVKYFNNELTDAEKEDFLTTINKDASLKKEFIQIQNLLGISDLLPLKEDSKYAQLSLSKFLKHINNENYPRR